LQSIWVAKEYEEIDMTEFKILKKNRKYFAASVNGNKCKILIDEYSQDLNIGEHALLVDDISIRSKYGTDLIFKLQASFSSQQDAGICSLTHTIYNKDLVNECRNLGGKFDKKAMAWIFSDIVEDKVEELDSLYSSELVKVELTALNDLYSCGDGIYFLGYSIARAFDRDAGAKLGDSVSLIKGRADSGGSKKNWATTVSVDSVFRIKIPKLLLQNKNHPDFEKFSFKVINNVSL
jgi:hypothetical protein